EVILVLGPSALEMQHPLVQTVRVTSANEMYKAAHSHHLQVDACIFAAAVADYRPASVATEKIKKEAGEMNISLKRNIDIAKTLGESKREGQIHVGFALETNDEDSNALVKLKKKYFDLIILNSLNDPGAGFQHDTNKVTPFFRNGDKETFRLLPKTEVAALIVQKIKKLLAL